MKASGENDYRVLKVTKPAKKLTINMLNFSKSFQPVRLAAMFDFANRIQF